MFIDRKNIVPEDTAAVEAAFAEVKAEPIACCNWPQEFPHAPQVQFRMFHTGDLLWLRFDVAEGYTKGEVTEDNGPVWTDSCVEFFLKLDEQGYYNLETTCIGTALLGFRKDRDNAVHAPEQIMRTVQRFPSLGTTPFAERQGDNRWSLTLAIPPQALFHHQITSWNGVEATANLYKCGDELSHPHFLSWRPIDNPTPNFHLPLFFENIKFK